MMDSPRKAVVAYMEVLRNQSGELDKSGLPTVCPRSVALDLQDAARRWERICRRAATLLDKYAAQVEGDEPLECIETAEEEGNEVMLWVADPDRMAAPSGSVDYEIGAALADTAKMWALLASKLMFAVESEGLAGLDPELVKEYQLACETEPERFSALAGP